MVVTRNVTSTRVVTAQSGNGVTPQILQPIALPLISEITTPVPLGKSLFSINIPGAPEELDEDQEATTEASMDIDETTLFEGMYLNQNRVPRIIDNPAEWSPEKIADVQAGQYHEVHPGQYHEYQPGQYNEVNPGQYHEVHPGQYHEVTPGQYHEVHPGQYSGEDLKVEVEVERNGDTRTYNVQSKVDEFIIGEYGTISGGQTLQGVRYTAVDDSSIDPQLIHDTLVNFFKFS